MFANKLSVKALSIKTLSVKRSCYCLAILSALITPLPAFSGSLYLPLQLSPEIEGQIEKLLVITNTPVIKRPIPIKLVSQALDKLDGREPGLSHSISRYLERYSGKVGVGHAELSAAAHSGADITLPNGRGELAESVAQASFSAYWAMSEFIALNVGAVAYDHDNAGNDEDDSEMFLSGSFLSLGFDVAQLDIGFRPHWFGPFQESDMLISTQAATMPSVTLSNITPLTGLNMSYEVFLGQMSEQSSIQSRDGLRHDVTGNPKLFGLHLSFAPFDGFALGFNRLMQYGGGSRDESFSSLAEAFVDARKFDNVGEEGNNFGNQLSSITTRFTFPGDKPFSVYMEYAGEDSSASSSYHIGNTALMLGIHMPVLTSWLDLTFEHAEWQNAWYVNGNYPESGLANFDTIIGHWGGTQRRKNDAVGSSVQMLKAIWGVGEGHSLISIYRQVENKDYSPVDYDVGRSLSLQYSTAYGFAIVGGELQAGTDVFGESFTRLSGFFRW